MWKKLIVLLLSWAFGLSYVQGQTSPVSAGETLTSSTGKIHQTIGQLVIINHSGSNGRIGQGVQRAFGQITPSRDTVICSGDTLPAFEARTKEGKWVVKSSIGTSIDQAGKLTIGANSTAKAIADTVEYYFNGFTDQVYVFSRPTLSMACTNATLIFDSQGVVNLDSAAISQVIPVEAKPVYTDLIPSIQSLTCMNGFEQEVSFSDATCADSCAVTLKLADTTRPVAICTNAADLVLVWQGLSIYPASISGNSTDNCGAGGLEFSFSSNFSQPNLILSCRQQLEQLDTATVYIQDQSGNITDCTVNLSYNYPSGEDCSCDWGQLKLKGEIFPDDYKAKETITALGKVTLGDTVSLKAGQKITLAAGFQVTQGSTLRARIDSCGNVPSFQQQAEKRIAGEDNSLRGAEDSGAGNLSLESLEVYPNPFSDWFRIQFSLLTPGRVSFELHNLQGGKVYHLLEEVYFESGIQELLIDGTRLVSGVYVLTAMQDRTMVSRQLVKL